MLERWPEAKVAIEASATPRSVCLDVGRCKTLVVNGAHLTSKLDRVREAFDQARLIPYETAEPWIYGVGLGDLPRMLLQRPTVKRLHVVILSRSITSASFQFEPPTWAADPRVELHMAKDVPSPVEPLAVSPIELRYCDEDAMRVRDCLTWIMMSGFVASTTAVLEKIREQNKAETADLRRADSHVSELYGTDKRPAIVIMGGPTLATHYQWIADRMGDHNIITASTSLQPLARHGIAPNVTIMIDPCPIQAKHFDGPARKDGTLVYSTDAHRSVIESWHGRRYHVDTKGGDLELYVAGSVVHSACDLARRMGAPTVYLVGADFCYPGGASHVDGATITTQTDGAWRPRTRDGNGAEVTSDNNHLMYRRQLEVYVARHDEVNWRKVDRRGLEVPGMRWVDG